MSLVWLISDTHGQHSKLKVPKYDVVIHCGDEANHPHPAMNANESRDFFDWFEALPGEKIFVPGNHSIAYQRGMVKPKVTCLVDQLYRGIYGSPWSPTFGGTNWVYNKSRSKMKDVWENIPKCDLLVTHGPPKGVLDLAWDIEGSNKLVHCGCRALFNKVMEIKPKVHIFGHIHSDRDIHNAGIYQNYGITFVNCSVVNNSYELVNDGFLLEV